MVLRGVSARRRSWYILFFQAPGLPERLLLAADCKFVGAALQGDGPAAPRRSGTISDEDVERCAGRLSGLLVGILSGFVACAM